MAQQLNKVTKHGLGSKLLDKLGLPNPIRETAEFANSEDARLKAAQSKLNADNQRIVASDKAKHSSTKSKSLLG